MTVKIASTNWFDLDADSDVSIAIPEVAPPTPVVAAQVQAPVATAQIADLVEVREDRVPKTRKSRRWGRVVSIAVFVAIVSAWFVVLRPTNLGGSASILVVRGVSMQPTMDYGDVIIAHRHSAYEVGDIIAFRVPNGEIGEGTVVIHRIIGGNATSGFQTQGDGNNEPDEWSPTPTDILGSATWRIPLVGRLFSALRTVPGIAVLAGVLAALLVLLGVEDTGRRHNRDKPDPPQDRLPVPSVAAEPPHEDPLDDIITPETPLARWASIDTDPLDDIITPPLPTVRSAVDHQEVGEYWGDDIGHLSEVIRDRERPATLFDDDLEVVARRFPRRWGVVPSRPQR